MFENVGQALRRARELSGHKTQRDASQVTGFSSQQISNWENGVKVPSLESLGRLLDSYQLTLHDFEDILNELNDRPPTRISSRLKTVENSLKEISDVLVSLREAGLLEKSEELLRMAREQGLLQEGSE